MVVLTAYATVLPDKVDAALEACRTVRMHSVKEAGCERYDFFQSPDDKTKIVFVEEWTSKAHLDTHFQQNAFKEFFVTVASCFQSHPEIRIFEASLHQ